MILGEWKIQLTTAINLMSSKDSTETRTMHSTSDNIEIMIGSKTDETIVELFESLLQKYQKGLEQSMKGSEFAFGSVDLLHYKCHKISPICSGTCIDSSKWLKNKKATINPKNNDEKCFPYAITVALNDEKIKSRPERKSNINPFINQCNWKEINFPLYKNEW